MHWTTSCADCGRSLRLSDRAGAPRLCPRCGAPAAPLPPPPKPEGPSRRWPWLVGVAAALALVLACLAAALPAMASRTPAKSPTYSAPLPIPQPDFPSPPLLPAQGPRRDPPVELAAPPDAEERPLADLVAKPWKPANRLPAFFASASAPDGGLFTADSEGVLRRYSADLRLLGQARLDRVAVALAFDARRGRLYAAVADPAQILTSRLGDRDRAVGDLAVYEVSRPLEGRLSPSYSIALQAQVTGLILSADGSRVYYLADSPQSGAHLGRIDPETLQRGEPLRVPANGNSSFAEAGEALAVLTGGLLYYIDPKGWTVERLLAPTQGTVLAIAPAAGGKTLMLERRGILTYVAVADLGRRRVLARYLAPFSGRVYLRTDAEGRPSAAGPTRFYLASSAVFDGQIQGYELSEAGEVTALGGAGRDGERLLRGGLHLGERFALSGNGHAYALPGRDGE